MTEVGEPLRATGPERGARDPDRLALDGRSTRRVRQEILLVLGLSLGASAVYAVVDLLNALTQPKALGDQSTTLNPSLDPRWIFDLLYQLLSIGTALVPVALALWFLAAPGVGALRRIGLDFRRPAFDVGGGVLLAAVIGIPGLGLYLAARALGLDVAVATSGIGAQWYAVPILVLSAARAALQEEVIVVGYLYDRLESLRWRPWAVVGASALLRGSYHLYQGFGGFVGNAIMGVVFGLVYRRWGRTAPLVVCHFILDLVSFVGYAVLLAVDPHIRL